MLDVETSAALVGTTLAETTLRLQEFIGRGGTSDVYRAVDTETGALHAVKVLRKTRNVDLLINEARVLESIDSPCVVRHHSLSVLPGGPQWLSMEHLSGRTLSRVLDEEGPIAPRRFIGWMQQVCRGLTAIHEQGWVHRDIKPSNLVLIEDGGEERVVIIDLGIAEREGSRPRDLSGTPDYIPPEQAMAAPVDPRSDIYSLGCCAYELLTNRAPISAANAAIKIDTHVDGVRLQWPHAPIVPAALRGLIEYCLGYRAESRPQSARELELELERCRWRLGSSSQRESGAPIPRSKTQRYLSGTLVGHPGVAHHEVDTLVSAPFRCA